jgi:hypothetical protein
VKTVKFTVAINAGLSGYGGLVMWGTGEHLFKMHDGLVVKLVLDTTALDIEAAFTAALFVCAVAWSSRRPGGPCQTYGTEIGRGPL